MVKHITVFLLSFLMIFSHLSDISIVAAETSEEAQAAVSEIETKIEEVTHKVNMYNSQIAELQKQIAIHENELAIAEETRATQENALKGRMRAAYVNGSNGYLELLFSSKDLTELWSNIMITREIINTGQDIQKRLTNAKLVIQRNKTLLESERNQIEAIKAEAESVQMALAQELSENEALFKSLQFKEKYSGQASVIDAVAAGELAESGWTWPVDANARNAFRITSLMGTRESPGGIGSTDHGGTDIGAAYGATIVSAHTGTVIEAGSNGGYGNCVTVQGVDGFITMYAHLSAIYVSEGESVTPGQALGACGSTGNSTGAHLHFEVRYGSEKINGLAFYGNDILGRLTYSS